MLNYYLDKNDIKKWSIITPNQQAKDLLFYPSEVGHFSVGPENFTERTDKKEYFLLFTVSGSGILKRNNQLIELEKNFAVMVYCEEYQYYQPTSEEAWDYLWIHFNGQGAQNYYSLINDVPGNHVNRIYISGREMFMKDINDIMQYPDVPDIRQSVLSSMHISNLLSTMVIDRYSDQNVKNLIQHQDSIDKVIAYIRQSYMDKITLEDFSEVAHLSKYYLLKLFKQAVGVTPYEYLLNYRINQAKKMLRTTEMSIAQVASFTGFQNESNFIRQFKAVTGATPLRFRKNETSY